MATNGESAAHWLEQNANQLSRQRVEQVRDNIQTKLDRLSEEAPLAPGLLEALEVLDQHLARDTAPQTSASGSPVATALPALDTSPLIPDLAPEEPLSAAEKQARFRDLLARNRTT
ncbi:hypothetical protein [Aestuariirhabdus sp. LZHN29]|uniref:hypothetical protein n=1 Tax=Aestuariirhabdus sp. LZHN29 TaxID=3417462 RepID=UPI003CFA85C4